MSPTSSFLTLPSSRTSRISFDFASSLESRFIWGPKRNGADYQGTGKTGRFSQASECESRGHSSNSLTPDAFQLGLSLPGEKDIEWLYCV